MITHIFSLPVYKYNIDKNCYNKKEIIKTIEDNYKKEKTRNNWEVGNSLKQSNLHHIHGDWDNKKFKELSYYLLKTRKMNNIFKSDSGLRHHIV